MELEETTHQHLGADKMCKFCNTELQIVQLHQAFSQREASNQLVEDQIHSLLSRVFNYARTEEQERVKRVG